MAWPAGIWNSTEVGMFGGPYDIVDGGGAGADPPVSWHILIASILHAPAAAGVTCMPIILDTSGGGVACGGACVSLLEHDATSAMIAARIARAPILASLGIGFPFLDASLDRLKRRSMRPR